MGRLMKNLDTGLVISARRRSAPEEVPLGLLRAGDEEPARFSHGFGITSIPSLTFCNPSTYHVFAGIHALR